MSSDWGYFVGGTTLTTDTGGVVTADKITYSTATTAAQTSANLSQGRFGLAGVSDVTDGKGYFAGGATGNAVFVATGDKITYSNDTTAAQTSAALSQARYWVTGISDNTDGKGYFAGGNTSSAGTSGLATADKIVYSTDTTAAQTSANLSQGRFSPGGVSDVTDGKGYFAGGSTKAGVTTADKLTYSTDTTAAQASANLSQARYHLTGVSDNTDGKGYFEGGATGNGVTPVSTADKLTYSNDTTAAQTTAKLTQVRYGPASVSDITNGNGYVAGGYSGADVTTADKITYSTDTTAAQTTARLSAARKYVVGVSANEPPIIVVTAVATYFLLMGVG